jgi:GNAT superfamily N-acetyltransferase
MIIGGVMVLLRDVRSGDAEALSQLITEFTHLSTTPAQIRQRLARSQDIEHPIVAELDGHVVGFASLRLVNYLGEDAPYAEISELFVSEPYRRQGIARALMAELEVRQVGKYPFQGRMDFACSHRSCDLCLRIDCCRVARID